MARIVSRPYNRLAMAILLVAAAALLACSDRPRSNPLDPQNPDQVRGNVGFNALAGNHQVLLQWDPLEFIDLEGIRIQRTEAGTDNTVTLNDSLPLPVGATSYLDNSPDNGVTYLYNLQFELKGSQEKPRTMSDTVEPGPVFAWLELVDYGQLVLMTPDFRDEANSLQASFYDIQDVQTGVSLWVLSGSQEGLGSLSLFSFSGELREENLFGISSIAAFQVDRRENSVWVAVSGSNGFVYHFGGGGNLQSSYTTGIRVASLAVDVWGSDVWVGSSEPTIARMNIVGEGVTKYSHSSFIKPEKVVTARETAGVWILDTGSRRALHFTDSGIEWEYADFNDPRDLVVSQDGSLCWVADFGADAVVVLDNQGHERDVITGLGMPHHLGFNSVDTTVYVSGLERLATKIDQNGQVLWQRTLPDRPGLIELAY